MQVQSNEIAIQIMLMLFCFACRESLQGVLPSDA